eukprot:CAMPEP_0170749798 /NCGR_PEP_ID=MMETSP0437-20130122/10587_1 /TAXON_ID=0 /ORGANISM="Sexangularia sp." /LENGTH=210 /DNA_ID=CAMNT_0011088745 /DNA_START=190 /DNA_END=822 /DNA_ORIENTATION=+
MRLPLPLPPTPSCTTCTRASIAAGGVVTDCTVCGCQCAWGSATKCTRCLLAHAEFGEPLPCDNCAKRAAFDRGADARAKVGGRTLCFLCTRQAKRDARVESLDKDALVARYKEVRSKVEQLPARRERTLRETEAKIANEIAVTTKMVEEARRVTRAAAADLAAVTADVTATQARRTRLASELAVTQQERDRYRRKRDELLLREQEGTLAR